MGFFEDYRRFLTKLCLDGHNLTPLRDPRARYHRMYEDFRYFVNNDWKFDIAEEAWEKCIKITTGKFKGNYRLRVEFHEDYPNVPPGVYIKKTSGGHSSEHLAQGIQHSHAWNRKNVCIQTPHGGICSRDKWWKKSMGVSTAVKLAIITANGEIDKKTLKRQRSKLYKMSIFGKMEKLKFDRIKFIKFIQEEANMKKDIDESWHWDELAHAFRRADGGIKRAISRYFLKHKPKDKPKNENK